MASAQKLLERLEAKGCVQRDRSERAHRFRPLVSREEFLGSRLQALADRLCDGALMPMVTTLLRSKRLSRSQREQLPQAHRRPVAAQGHRYANLRVSENDYARFLGNRGQQLAARGRPGPGHRPAGPLLEGPGGIAPSLAVGAAETRHAARRHRPHASLGRRAGFRNWRPERKTSRPRSIARRGFPARKGRPCGEKAGPALATGAGCIGCRGFPGREGPLRRRGRRSNAPRSGSPWRKGRIPRLLHCRRPASP